MEKSRIKPSSGNNEKNCSLMSNFMADEDSNSFELG